MRRDRKIIVLACRRTLPFSRPDVLELPCSGRLSIPLLLRFLRRGADGVVVAGCPEERCLHQGGATIAARAVAHAEELLDLIGIRDHRIRFVPVLADGFDRPVNQAVSDLSQLAPLGVNAGAEPSSEPQGMDAAIEDLELLAVLHEGIDIGNEPAPSKSKIALFAGRAMAYDRLVGDVLGSQRPGTWIHAAVELLRRENEEPPQPIRAAGIGAEWIGTSPTIARNLSRLVASDLERRGVKRVYSLFESDLPLLKEISAESGVEVASIWDRFMDFPPAFKSSGPLPRFAVVAEPGARAAESLAAAGVEVVEVGRDLSDDGNISWTPAWAKAAGSALKEAEANGARFLAIESLRLALRFALLCRSGAWLESTVRPMHLASALRMCAGETDDRRAAT